jgi:hypothetical protein
MEPLTSMRECHRFIYSVDEMKKFYDMVGFEKKTHQTFIAVRLKYSKDTSVKNRVLSQKCVYDCTFERFVDLIKKYELPVGCYKEGDLVLPNECMVVYCTTNARNTKQGVRKLIMECMDAAFSGDDYVFNHMNTKLNGAIMASKDKTLLTTIDIDSKDEYQEVKEFLEENKIVPAGVVETRGGYHVLLRTDDNLGDVYRKFSKKHTMGDTFCPIPGTLQGGFPVRFV